MSLHGAKGERDLKQRVWNTLTVEICGKEGPRPAGGLLNSVCLSSDPRKGSPPSNVGASFPPSRAPSWSGAGSTWSCPVTS